MGIYIKGMEMPSTCEECRLESFCNLWIEAIKMSGVELKVGAKATIRHPDCPLIPVPPHGRLGDLDKLESGLRHMAKYQHDERQQGILGCCETIRLAPAIIPADEEGE